MNTIASVAELREYMEKTSDLSDVRLQLILDSAVAFMEKECARTFQPSPVLAGGGADTNPPVVKTFSTKLKTYVRLPDLREVATGGLKINGYALAPRSQNAMLGYILEGPPEASAVPGNLTPFNAVRIYAWSLALAGYWTDGLRDLTIEGRWGFTVPPPDIKECVLALSARRAKEKDALWSDAIALPEGGGVSYFRQMPPFVQNVIEKYRIPKFALV